MNNFVQKIKETDFLTFPDPSVPFLDNNLIIDSLVDFFNNHFSAKELAGHTGHDLDILVRKCTIDDEAIPIAPRGELRRLGTLLHFANKINSKVCDMFKGRFLSNIKEYYKNMLFELQVGIRITQNDSSVEFYEILSGEENVPDFKIAMDKSKIIYLDVYRRNVEDQSNEFWQNGPHSEENIKKIDIKFVETTCNKIRGHRKKTLQPDDIFVLVFRFIDPYLAKCINFQALVNDLPPKSVLVKYDRYLDTDSFTEKWELYFQHQKTIEENEEGYIKGLFDCGKQ